MTASGNLRLPDDALFTVMDGVYLDMSLACARGNSRPLLWNAHCPLSIGMYQRRSSRRCSILHKSQHSAHTTNFISRSKVCLLCRGHLQFSTLHVERGSRAESITPKRTAIYSRNTTLLSVGSKWDAGLLYMSRKFKSQHHFLCTVHRSLTSDSLERSQLPQTRELLRPCLLQ